MTMNLEKTVNIIAIVLLLGLSLAALMVMQKTTESNVVTTQATVHHANKESLVAKEVRLLSLDVKSLQKDVAEIKKRTKRKNKGWKRPQGK